MKIERNFDFARANNALRRRCPLPVFSYSFFCRNHPLFCQFVLGRFGSGATGYAEYVFTTASPPSGGECRAIKGDVIGLDILNTFICEGWTSSSGSTDLIFQYFYKKSPDGTEYMVQYARDSKTGGIRLPLGLKEYNYTLLLKAVIFDRSGSKAESYFDYQVQFVLSKLSGRRSSIQPSCEKNV